MMNPFAMLISSAVLIVVSLNFTLAEMKHKKSTTRRIPKEELDPQFWVQKGREELDMALNRKLNNGNAKNIILFLGDGMGVSTVTAARIYKGQSAGRPGEESMLTFERFPNMGLSKTYNVDHQIADSAATATAFLCGVKANYGTLGLDPRVKRGQCDHIKNKNLTCILELAQQARKSTGIVTTSRVTHATPAPLYAHSADRMWENDRFLQHLSPRQRHHCTDIASQLMGHVGKDINVLMGGGRRHLMPEFREDPEYAQLHGERLDGRDLIEEWMSDKLQRGKEAEFVWNQKGFDEINTKKTDYVLGLFEYSHMKFNQDRRNDPGGEPSLAEMVEKAISVLSKNDEGFFLLVEGARIDHAHHGNTAKTAFEEVIAMDEAVKAALDLVNQDETLMIVTADHSHPLSISSYATRGNPILGLTDYSDDYHKNGLSDIDLLPYTTLSYANGPGYLSETPRRNLAEINTESDTYRQATSVPTSIVSHEGSDVAIYALGPMAHLFHRTHEQHYIFHVMAYAAALGEHHMQLHPDLRYSKYEADPGISVKTHDGEGLSAGRIQEQPPPILEPSSSAQTSRAAQTLSGIVCLIIPYIVLSMKLGYNI